MTAVTQHPLFIKALLLVLVMGVVFLHIISIHLPAFNYDELMWIGVALNEPNAPFTGRKLGGHTIYLMSYIGALKGYIYAVIFKFFAPGFLSVRLPLILAAIGATLLLKLPDIKGLSERSKWGAVIFLILCPTVTYYAHMDHGPSTLEYISKCFLIALTMRVIWTSKLTVPNIIAITFIVSLAFWNKASFIAFSIGLGAFFFAYSLIFKSVKRRAVTALFGVFLIGYSLSLYSFLLEQFQLESVSAIGFFPDRIAEIIENLSGFKYLSHVTGYHDLAGSGLAFYITLLAVICAGIVFLFAALSWLGKLYRQVNKTDVIETDDRENDKISSLILLFAVTSASSIGFLLISSLAFQPWHLYITFPSLPLLLIFCLLIWKAKTVNVTFFPSRLKKFRGVAILCLTLIFSAAALVRVSYAFNWPEADNNSKKGFGRLMNNVASTQFFADSRKFTGDIYVGDWGLTTQIIAYGHGKDRNSESVWEWRFDQPQYNAHYFNQLENTLDSGIMVFHGKGATAFPKVKTIVFDYILEQNLSVELCKKYTDPDGVDIVEVWASQCLFYLEAIKN